MSLSGSGAGAEHPRATTLGDVPESAVLARLFPRLPQAVDAEIGPGDDAAVMRARDGRFVVTTDAMVHGPDFRLAWSTPYDLGWKAAATNLSDVAAMGAWPTGLVVVLAAPARTPLSDIDRLADGLRDACTTLAPGCGVVGGDLSVSDTLTIAVTAFGDLGGRAPVLRSGALPGDVVAYRGELGVAFHGLRMLFERAVDAAGSPDPALAALLRGERPTEVDAQLAPRPPVSAGVEAARAGAHAMMDVSDGLAIDGGRMAIASGVSIDFSSSALTSIAFGADVSAALAGGEDHGLLATFAAGAPLPAGFVVIGRVLPAWGDGAAESVSEVAGDDAGRGSGTVAVAAGQGSGVAVPVLVDGVPYDGSSGWNPYRGWDGAAG